VIDAALLVTFPMAAVTVTVPPVVMPDTIVTVPADTVARFVLLEVHVATSVTGSDPLQVTASAVRETVGSLVVTVPLVGDTAIDVMHPTVTVTVAVADTDAFELEVAVTVAVPVLTAVTSPEEEIVAVEVGVMLQETEGFSAVLPSLLVPVTVIWTVLSVLPVSMVGLAGPMARDDSTGF